ncbi:hypothetical protein Scep_005887 [Stephania cephalantha]|uniref:Uncharacterized protein n=1 Tax=Stephania cephalantha TaxID=152367 RepID=A0AAP0KV64_9MAGN
MNGGAKSALAHETECVVLPGEPNDGPTLQQQRTGTPRFASPQRTPNAGGLVRSLATRQDLSSLVLFDDDGPNEHFGRNQARETHVAFSVEGLGKIGLETPVHSPVRPNRAFSPGYPILNAAKRQHLSKMRDNREHQLNPMVHYVNEPLADCAMDSAFSLKGVGEHSGKLRSSKPSSQGCMPVETTDYQMDNEFGKEWPCDNNVDSEEAWNVRSDKAKCSSSSFRVGESMKRDDTLFFKSTAGNYCEEELFWEELGYKKTNINYRKSLKRSERPTMVQNPSGAYTVHSNDLLRTKKDLEFQRTWTWSYEEGCTSADILSDLGSFHNDIKADFAPFEWELYHKDPFSSSPELKLCRNRQTSFKKSKFDDPVECLPSSDRIFEPDSPLCSYNPPMFSNIRSMTKDSHISCASRTVGELPHSSKITDSQGAKKFCSISRQEGVKHAIGLQPSVYDNRLHVAEEEVSVGNNNIPTEAEKTTDGQEDGSNECEVKEESKGSIKSKTTSNSSENTEETLSSTKEVSAKQENCPDEKK